MSIDINWETLTGGSDGASRAEAIRAFIHDRFQQVTLPRFIRSVHVHSFDFGSVPPEIEIKDICDPLSDFYEEDEDYPDEEEDAMAADDRGAASGPSACTAKERRGGAERRSSNVGQPLLDQSRLVPPFANTRTPGLRTTLARVEQLGSPFIPGASTPGIPGGTSNINYFHLPLGAGLSGSTTPLAAVAGAQLQGWPDFANVRPSTPTNMRLRHAASMNSLTLTPQSNPDPTTRPSSQHQHDLERKNSLVAASNHSSDDGFERTPSPSPPRMREKSPEDIQIMTHIQYSGDIKMSLTAEILLDYPMPSFVGIPLKLNITGLTFDGVAILAYIKKRAHFCFLSPEDADALIGGETNLDSLQTDVQKQDRHPAQRLRVGGLLEHIKVESEIGSRGEGGQVLKNVGKVESFVPNNYLGYALRRKQNVPWNASCTTNALLRCHLQHQNVVVVYVTDPPATKEGVGTMGQPTCSCLSLPHETLYLLSKCSQPLARCSFGDGDTKCRIPTVERVTLQCIAGTCSTKQT